MHSYRDDTLPNNRTFAAILAVLAAAAVFVALVHAVLVAADVADPAAITVHGLTMRRLWATTAALLALFGTAMGGLALRPRQNGKRGKLATAALVAGLIAALNGGLNLSLAQGGPGSGNGVVGAAAAVVLGAVGAGLAALAMTRCKRLE